ncbi:MAG TPA: TetR/AcrR family transcriptional regulator [Candidatus Limnocylindria bacterium]|nr:TetR/AcrR family transcriptional regulator [Candidatus Limnocylindria bacterium]
MPAPRPRNRRGPGLTKERLLQAADRLWSERGIRGASLDDIARDAAVTKPTLYYYFADKSGLFTEMVCSVLEQHGGGLRTASRASPSARERLVAASAYLIRAQCSAPRLLREGGIRLTTDQQSQTRSAFFRNFFSPVQSILDDGVRSGELRPMDTAFAAQAVLNLIDPWIGRDARPGGRTADQLASDIVDLVIDGIGPSGRSP